MSLCGGKQIPLKKHNSAEVLDIPSEKSDQSLSIPRFNVEIIHQDVSGTLALEHHQLIRTPSSEIENNLPLTHSVSSTTFDVSNEPVFQTAPLLSELSGSHLLSALVEKCNEIGQICDFINPDPELINAKTTILNDILGAVSKPEVVEMFTQTEYHAIVKCFQANIVRAPAPPPVIWFAPAAIDFSTDKVEEISWDHLELCYGILYAFLNNPSFNPSLCESLTDELLTQVIGMFKSPDSRERQKLSTIFHSLYRVFRRHRKSALKLLSEFFFEAIDSPCLGCAELLTALVSIIAGLKVPIRVEYLSFYHDVLLGLHKCSNMHMFFSEFLTATAAYLQKSSQLAYDVFSTIFRYWSVSDSRKKVFFLNEIDLFAQFLNHETVAAILPRLLSILEKSIVDECYAVAERSLIIFKNEQFLSITCQNAEMMFPRLIPPMLATARTHWCTEVGILATGALTVLKNSDEVIFRKTVDNLIENEKRRIAKEIESANKWAAIIRPIASKSTWKRISSEIAEIFDGCKGFSQNSDS